MMLNIEGARGCSARRNGMSPHFLKGNKGMKRVIAWVKCAALEVWALALYIIMRRYQKRKIAGVPASLLRNCDHLLAKGPNNGIFRQFLGAIYGEWLYGQGNYGGALEIWERALDNGQPRGIVLFFMLPAMHRELDYRRMIPFFEENLKIHEGSTNPDNWRRYMLGYEMYSALGEKNRAREMLQTARQLAPNELEFFQHKELTGRLLEAFWKHGERFPQ